MQLNESLLPDIQHAMQEDGLRCSIGPFALHLRSGPASFMQTLAHLYEGIAIEFDPGQHFNDFTVSLRRPRNLRRYYRPQVRFAADSETPFEPFPLDHGFPHFEWGLNWLISTRAQQYLMLHAAVLERHNQALVMPAIPGSGKSTLCAALMLQGWRLLSDEFGLYRPETGMLDALPRPIPLKNESIDVIKDYSSDAIFGPTYPKTRKGDVAHLRATSSSTAAARSPAKPAWIVFPQYLTGATELLHPFARGRAFLKVSGNSFNYRLQGARGFTAVADIIDSCTTWYLEFSDLDKAVKLLNEMTDSSAG